jgi:hypothetical protein
VGDPENIGPFPENEHPFSTCFVSPEQSSFSPSAELGIHISDNSAIHNLYWWNEPAGKWYAVDAEMDNNDGFLKAAITKSGYYMMTYPVVPTKPTAEPTIPSEPTIPTESTALPTTAQTPLGFLGILTGLGAFALLKKK